MEKDLEQIFSTLEKKRDIEKCSGCHFFSEHEDGTFCCRNVSHFFGHPWCFESRLPLKKEWFEKATINFQYRDLCQQSMDFKKGCNDESESG